MHARRSTGNPAVFVTKTGGFASRPHDRFAFCNRVNYWMERTRVCGTVQCVAKRRRPVRHRKAALFEARAANDQYVYESGICAPSRGAVKSANPHVQRPQLRTL